MKVITFNLNGIRSALRKGFFEWMQLQDADFICVQELKAQEKDMTAPSHHRTRVALGTPGACSNGRRTEQNRTEQNRTEQNRTEQNRKDSRKWQGTQIP